MAPMGVFSQKNKKKRNKIKDEIKEYYYHLVFIDVNLAKDQNSGMKMKILLKDWIVGVTIGDREWWLRCRLENAFFRTKLRYSHISGAQHALDKLQNYGFATSRENGHELWKEIPAIHQLPFKYLFYIFNSLNFYFRWQMDRQTNWLTNLPTDGQLELYRILLILKSST